MLRKAVFVTILALSALAIVPPDAQAACNITVQCPSSCSLSLTCPNQSQISCVNQPVPPSVSCAGNVCSSGQYGTTLIYAYAQCDSNRVYCYPYACSQGADWIQCNNSGPVQCSGGGIDQ